MKYAIFGTGSLGEIVTDSIGDIYISCFIDNYKQKDELKGKPIYSLEEFLSSEFFGNKIIVATSSYDIVKKQLVGKHLIEDQDFFDGRNIVVETYYKDYTWRNESFKFEEKKNYLKTYFCETIFESYLANYKNLNPLDPRLKDIEMHSNEIHFVNYNYQLEYTKKPEIKKEYKNIHLISENIFAYNLYHELLSRETLSNNLFVIIDGGKHRDFFSENKTNIIKVKREEVDNYSLNVELIGYLNNSEKIFIHFLSDNICRMLNTHVKGNQKIYWAIFGGDLYPYINQELYSEETKEILINLNKDMDFNLNPSESRLKLVSSLNGILTWNKYDYFLAKEFLGLKAEMIHFSHPINEISVEIHENKNSTGALKILLGNSGTPENNHINIMSFLKDYIEEIDKIYLPLAYGDPEYIESIKEIGYSTFGEKLVPILDFMEFEKYVALINECEIIFMNHFRQQGGGNIFLSLNLGKTVYINSFVTTYKVYKDYGMNIYPLDEILNSSLKINSLSDLIKAYNINRQRKIIEEFRKSLYNNYNIFD